MVDEVRSVDMNRAAELATQLGQEAHTEAEREINPGNTILVSKYGTDEELLWEARLTVKELRT